MVYCESAWDINTWRIFLNTSQVTTRLIGASFLYIGLCLPYSTKEVKNAKAEAVESRFEAAEIKLWRVINTIKQVRVIFTKVQPGMCAHTLIEMWKLSVKFELLSFICNIRRQYADCYVDSSLIASWPSLGPQSFWAPLWYRRGAGSRQDSNSCS